MFCNSTSSDCRTYNTNSFFLTKLNCYVSFKNKAILKRITFFGFNDLFLTAFKNTKKNVHEKCFLSVNYEVSYVA